MSNDIRRDILSHHRELKEVVTIYYEHAYRYGFYKVFEDFIDYCLAQYCPALEYTLPDYIQEKPDERHDFTKMLDAVIGEVRKKANLWTGDRSASGWYDPFGHFFESVASQFGKAYRGQFFTPEPLCTMMAQMTVGDDKSVGKSLCEPACGSGRFLLAVHAQNPGFYCVSNDIDALCAKMTAVNYCLNGLVGEITCNDGLFPDKERFRFAYKCMPLIATNLGSVSAYKIMCMLSPSLAKQYILIPIAYEESWYRLDNMFRQKPIVLPPKKACQDVLFDLDSIESVAVKKQPDVKKKQTANNSAANSPSLFDG